MGHGVDLKVATELEEQGEWSEAATTFRALLRLGDPEGGREEMLIRLAACLLETGGKGRPEEVEELLAEAQPGAEAAEDPELRARYLLVKGKLHDLRGEVRRALDYYRSARGLLHDAHPYVAQADLALASAERRRGELQSALVRLQALDGATLPERRRADLLDELGAVHLARGDTQKAIETLERALQLDQAATSEYAAGRSRLLLAEAYLRSGLRKKAKAEIDQAVAAYGREQADSGLSEAYALLGLWHEESEDYVNAAHFYLKGHELDRLCEDLVGQARAKRCLGRLFRKKGDSDRAQEYFSEARDLLPRDDDVEMAALLTEEGQLALGGADPNYAEAIDCFEKALRIAEDDADQRAMAIAQRNIANAHKESNSLELAVRLLRQAEATLRERGDLRELDDLLDDLGEVYLEQGKFEEALTCLNESLDLDRALGTIASQGRSLLLLGRTQLQIGRLEEARDNFERALDVFELAEHDVGRSDALHDLGSLYADEGRLADAIRCFRKGLDLDKRLDDPVGVVRANRALASAYRRRGDLERAEELLDEAEQGLRGIRDESERALLDMERGRLALASGSYREARTSIRKAKGAFAGKSDVQAAMCDRLLAKVATAEGGKYREAEALLLSARATFEAAHDNPELDEVWDDLAEVYLRTGQLREADEAARRSLEIGHRMGWGHGRGRSLLLLADIAMHQGDLAQALKHLEAARIVYDEVDDEVGLSDTHQLLGDWWANDRNHDRDYARAAYNYKEARRFDQAHRDLRGMARCNRKLASVYRLLGQHHRAAESLDQAQDNLRGIDDPREVAPLELEVASLHVARGEHAEAIPCLRRALQAFKSLEQTDGVTRTYQLLVTCHQSLNQVREALEYIRELGLEHASMWHVLLQDLHPLVASEAQSRFSNGDYSSAVKCTFEALEREFRSRAAALDVPPGPAEIISEVIKSWLRSDVPDVPRFTKSSTTQRFSEFCVASFDLIRNSATHDGRDFSARDAFVSLAVAHFIAAAINPPPASG